MKRKVSILLVSVAYLAVMAEYIIPHHHHNNMFCTVMEQCEDDGNINDEHTDHHEGEQSHDNNCLAETDYIAPKTCSQPACSAVSCDDFTHGHGFSLLFPAAGCLMANMERLKTKPRHREYVSFHTSAGAGRLHGLRAPPFIG
ncbi:MAG: hypothetical protein LBV26_01935 [Bacteroidales bacterium]|nr:hypothetical protein [Bacteroidales bacterium]